MNHVPSEDSTVVMGATLSNVTFKSENNFFRLKVPIPIDGCPCSLSD